MHCADCGALIPQDVGRCPVCAPPAVSEASAVVATSKRGEAVLRSAEQDRPGDARFVPSGGTTLRVERVPPVRAGVESRAWVGAGYLFAVLGGLIGLGIGGMLLAATVDDDEVGSLRRFGPETRGHAKVILVLGAFVCGLVFALSR